MKPFNISDEPLTELNINDRVTIAVFEHRAQATVVESQIYRRRQLVTVYKEANEPGPSCLTYTPSIQHFHQNRAGAFVRVTQTRYGEWIQYHNTRLITPAKA